MDRDERLEGEDSQYRMVIDKMFSIIQLQDSSHANRLAVPAVVEGKTDKNHVGCQERRIQMATHQFDCKWSVSQGKYRA
jgi:hypothetical protein